MSDEQPLLVEVADGVATVTLDRPERRNALSSGLLRALAETMPALDADPDVAAIVLTGADPAFCAGLDLGELGSQEGALGRAVDGLTAPGPRGPFPAGDTPVIGAVNGVAITGGLELALHCDFLVASERARFGDTHTRIGVQPGWGLSVLLPQAIGLRRAREMSFTGDFLTAEEALRCGLVNHVVPHDELLPLARRLAAAIASNDAASVRQLRGTYAEGAAGTVAEAWAVEARRGRGDAPIDPDEVARRRQAVIDRGRTQPG